MSVKQTRMLVKQYRIYCLHKGEIPQPQWPVDLSSGETIGVETDWPDLILRTLTVPYIDNAEMTVFHDWYNTVEEAEQAIIKSGVSNSLMFVILPVYIWATHFEGLPEPSNQVTHAQAAA